MSRATRGTTASPGRQRSESRVDALTVRTASSARPTTEPGRALLHLRKADPVLARVIDTHPDFDPRAWMAGLPPMDAFGALVFQITGQQLSIPSTRSILGRLQERFRGRFPTPEELAALTPADLRQLGFSRAKSVTLREVARQFRDGRLSDRALRRLSDTEIEALLTRIKGIGPWTVHGFLILALDRPDVTLPGDLALRKAIQRTYRLRRLPSPERVLKLAEAWRPYRSLATSYLFLAGFKPAA
jgi:DNA-3-methyladenine glycosylase II